MLGLSATEGSRDCPITWSISACTFSCTSGYLIMNNRPQFSVVDVVSVPATNKSKVQKHKFSSLNPASTSFLHFSISARKQSI
uniref:Uncharacterized protein n=1 Tax=Anguilla anguilla TaxID=7936 RepID=A0A0E9XUI7_ANGAN